ncbi:amidohydrolase family protein, partial [Roseateles sp. GG27B]
EEDKRVLAASGAQVAFCPSSNLFLGSGLFDWPAARAAGLAVSVASDVGGGTSLSLQRNLLDGYKVQALLGHRLSAWVGLHAATRGAAEALGLALEMGHFGIGTLAGVVCGTGLSAQSPKRATRWYGACMSECSRGWLCR